MLQLLMLKFRFRHTSCEVVSLTKENEQSNSIEEMKKSVLHMRESISQWDLSGMTKEQMNELGGLLDKLRQRFNGMKVLELARQEQEKLKKA